jgi:hypothetical protein
MTGHNLGPALLVLVGAAVVFGALEQVVKVLAKPEREDPRLGVAAFWVWTFSVAALTCAVGPYMTSPNPSLEWLIWGMGAIGWLAWKLGLNDEWETTARDREEIWASTIGTILGVVAFHMRS